MAIDEGNEEHWNYDYPQGNFYHMDDNVRDDFPRTTSHNSNLTTPPLTESEYGELANEIGLQNYGQASFTRLVSNSNPSTSHEHLDFWGELCDEGRADTLDNNPLCVNPHEVIASNGVKVEQQQHLDYVIDEQSNVIIDGWVGAIVQPGIGDVQFSEAIVPGPTSRNPCAQPWPGVYNFKVAFEKLSSNAKARAWDYSTQLEKLYIDMDKFVMASCFLEGNLPEGLMIRILPIYSLAGFISQPVKRCPNHASSNDATNVGMNQSLLEHLIRVDNNSAVYEEDMDTKRLSVVIPLQPPQLGSSSFNFSLKFMCLGSDVGGINRKPVKVVFTLEEGAGNVVGRYSVDVRICSCPKRDRNQEETRVNKVCKEVASKLSRANSSLVFSHPPNKRRRIDKEVEEMVLLPVAKADFQFMNQIAESQMIARHMNKVQEIKNQRKRLLLQHNPNSFTVKSKSSNSGDGKR